MKVRRFWDPDQVADFDWETWLTPPQWEALRTSVATRGWDDVSLQLSFHPDWCHFFLSGNEVYAEVLATLKCSELVERYAVPPIFPLFFGSFVTNGNLPIESDPVNVLAAHGTVIPQVPRLLMFGEMIPNAVSLSKGMTQLSLGAWVGVIGQVMFGLEKAFRMMHFHHADLHAGNVLLRSTTLPSVRFAFSPSEWTELPLHGVQPVIIDFGFAVMDGIRPHTEFPWFAATMELKLESVEIPNVDDDTGLPFTETDLTHLLFALTVSDPCVAKEDLERFGAVVGRYNGEWPVLPHVTYLRAWLTFHGIPIHTSPCPSPFYPLW